MPSTTVTTKGPVTIPKKIRDFLRSDGETVSRAARTRRPSTAPSVGVGSSAFSDAGAYLTRSGGAARSSRGSDRTAPSTLNRCS
jgi:hypothetical protein